MFRFFSAGGGKKLSLGWLKRHYYKDKGEWALLMPHWQLETEGKQDTAEPNQDNHNEEVNLKHDRLSK